MSGSSLEDGNEAHVVNPNDSKHQEDLKMYIRLPYYDDFQSYDLGAGGILSQIAHKIYADFRTQSWETLKHHAFMAKITKKLFKELNDVTESDKRTISNRRECSAG